MRIAMRADASEAVGFGHVSRCLALAEALVRDGNHVALVSAQLPVAMSRRASDVGVAHVPLAACGEHTDATSFTEVVGRWSADLCVVDSYALGAEWERVVRASGCAVAAIDDLGREHTCDVLIDANAGAAIDRYKDRVPSEACLLLGPRYAMLGRAFGNLHRDAVARSRVNRVFVSYGGTDPTGETLKAIEALLPLTDIGVDVAVTGAHPQLARVLESCAGAEHVRVHVDRDDLEQLLGSSDVALGAAGVSALERACLAVPSLLTVIADNQSEAAAALADAGAALLLGSAASVNPARLRAAVHGVRACPDLLTRMSARCLNLVDGRGARRVAAALTSLRMRLRRAAPEDARPMYEWRNDPRTRAFSLDPRPLDWEEHCRWLASRLADDRCDLLVASDERGPVGVLRFDVSGESATVSIYLAPQRQRAGIGAPLLRTGERWLQKNRPQVAKLRATILEANGASLRAFAEAGYVGVQREFVRGVSPDVTTQGRVG